MCMGPFEQSSEKTEAAVGMSIHLCPSIRKMARPQHFLAGS
jgi:hypothetical protein